MQQRNITIMFCGTQPFRLVTTCASKVYPETYSLSQLTLLSGKRFVRAIRHVDLSGPVLDRIGANIPRFTAGARFSSAVIRFILSKAPVITFGTQEPNPALTTAAPIDRAFDFCWICVFFKCVKPPKTNSKRAQFARAA